MITKNFQSCNVQLSVTETRWTLSAFRALWEKHAKEKTLTPDLRDFIISITVLIENRISILEEIKPELPQSNYDDIEDQKLEILSPTIL